MGPAIARAYSRQCQRRNILRSLDHRSASCYADDRRSATPALWSPVTLLGIWWHGAGSCQYRSTIIDYLSIISYFVSAISDTLSKLVDMEAFRESVFPGKEQLAHTDEHRLCGWLIGGLKRPVATLSAVAAAKIDQTTAVS